MGHFEFIDQPLHSLRFLERIEVFALDIFDQRHGQRRLVRNVPNDDRHFAQASHSCSSPAALASDDFVAILLFRTQWTDQDRLNESL